MTLTQWIVASLFCVLLIYFFKRHKRYQQSTFIKLYRFNSGVIKKFRQKHPQLSDEQVIDVFDGLRDYFMICHHAKRKNISMPSQVVDDAWHEFILFTRLYNHYCQKAFGRFLHHTPAEAMASATMASEGIKRAWRIACAIEDINPKAPAQLPRLFDMDKRMAISNGFYYSPNCKDTRSRVTGDQRRDYCANHIGCSSGCMGDSGSLSSDSGGLFGCGGDSGGGDSGCGSGCGGD